MIDCCTIILVFILNGTKDNKILLLVYSDNIVHYLSVCNDAKLGGAKNWGQDPKSREITHSSSKLRLMAIDVTRKVLEIQYGTVLHFIYTACQQF